MSEPIIRKARHGDEEGIHEAHMRSIREICAKDYGEDAIQGWGNRSLGTRWVAAIRDGFIWVVEYQNEIHGHAYIKIFKDDSEKKAHIMGLYLTPEVLKRGLGVKLVMLMVEKAEKRGVKKITLESTITAYEFYRALGFVDDGSMICQEVGGSVVRCLPMVLHLP